MVSCGLPVQLAANSWLMIRSMDVFSPNMAIDPLTSYWLMGMVNENSWMVLNGFDPFPFLQSNSPTRRLGSLESFRHQLPMHPA